jgi:hypothetical protein
MHGATVKIVWLVVIVSVDVRRSWETAMAKCTLRQASSPVEVRMARVKMSSFVQIWSYPSGEVVCALDVPIVSVLVLL